MLYRQWIAVMAIAAWPFAAGAQIVKPTRPQTQADVTNPSAPAAPFNYESAFTNYQATAGEEASPDIVWRSANDEMGRLGGHAGHMAAPAASPARPPQGEAATGSPPARMNDKTDARPAAAPAGHSKHH